jgi:hypothetical protein
MLTTARLVLLAACCGAVAAAAQEETVDWRDAARCVGRVCGVRGTVAVTETDGPTFRLYFDAEQRDVRVLLMRGWLVWWPSYTGATIVATGKVRRFRDHIEQIVLDPDDIQILAPGPADVPTASSTPVPSPTAAGAAPVAPLGAPSPPAFTAAPPTPGEVEQLRQRVRELEERVHQLESQ